MWQRAGSHWILASAIHLHPPALKFPEGCSFSSVVFLEGNVVPCLMYSTLTRPILFLYPCGNMQVSRNKASSVKAYWTHLNSTLDPLLKCYSSRVSKGKWQTYSIESQAFRGRKTVGLGPVDKNTCSLASAPE